MKEELITLETAKLTKEEGFDITCIWYYHDKHKEFPVEKGGGKIKVPLNWNSDDNGMTVKCYSAPTQSLLQRWLREEHYIHIEVRVVYEKSYFSFSIFKLNPHKYIYRQELKKGKILNYEEALEEGLKEALKLI